MLQCMKQPRHPRTYDKYDAAHVYSYCSQEQVHVFDLKNSSSDNVTSWDRIWNNVMIKKPSRAFCSN